MPSPPSSAKRSITPANLRTMLPARLLGSLTRRLPSSLLAALVDSSVQPSDARLRTRPPIEEGFQADGETGLGADVAHGEQDARHEGRAVERIVADRQRLALRAEDDLLVGDEAGDTQG